jgi:hypothetical protein
MMQRFKEICGSLCVAALIAMTAVLAWSAPQSAPAQAATGQGDSATHIVFRRFSYPIYPSLAHMSNIVGDVILKVSFRPDGSVESLAAVSGDPMLTQAALDSARQSQFECRSCVAPDLSQSLIYAFRIIPGEPDPCCCSSRPGVPGAEHATEVSWQGNRITITDPPLCICPDACSRAWAAAHSRYRSAKCLYLWKCGKRQIWIR